MDSHFVSGDMVSIYLACKMGVQKAYFFHLQSHCNFVEIQRLTNIGTYSTGLNIVFPLIKYENEIMS